MNDQISARLGRPLTQKDFLTIEAFTREDLLQLLVWAESLRGVDSGAQTISYQEGNKRWKFENNRQHLIENNSESWSRNSGYPNIHKTEELLQQKAVSMLFALPSTRTKAAVETAIIRLGGHPLFLAAHTSQLQRGESVEDTIKSLEPYSEAFMIRTDDHQFLIDAAAATTKPVINVLSHKEHPCEALAQILTMYYLKALKNSPQEQKSWSFSFDKITNYRCAYIGDCGNVAVSLAWCAAKLAIPLTIAAPPGYTCSENLQKALQNTSVTFVTHPEEAARDADVIFGDTYVSMGQEKESKKRKKAFKNYQVNEKLVQAAKDNYIYLHCLPAYRGEEVSSGVIDGEHSHVFAVAENRLLIYRALLIMLCQIAK